MPWTSGLPRLGWLAKRGVLERATPADAREASPDTDGERTERKTACKAGNERHHMNSYDPQRAADRRAAVASVRGSLRAEGLEPTEAFDADADLYARGELSVDELVERAERRHCQAAEPSAE